MQTLETYIAKYEDELLEEWSNLVKPDTFPAFCAKKFESLQDDYEI